MRSTVVATGARKIGGGHQPRNRLPLEVAAEGELASSENGIYFTGLSYMPAVGEIVEDGVDKHIRRSDGVMVFHSHGTVPFCAGIDRFQTQEVRWTEVIPDSPAHILFPDSHVERST